MNENAMIKKHPEAKDAIREVQKKVINFCNEIANLKAGNKKLVSKLEIDFEKIDAEITWNTNIEVSEN